MNNDIDLFVEALDEDWQRLACAQLLDDMRATASLSEHMKWGHPYFDHNGAAVTKWFCAKGWINVYFFRGRELADPHGLFEDSTNSRMLTVRITRARGLDRDAFRNLVRDAVALAEADDHGSSGSVS